MFGRLAHSATFSLSFVLQSFCYQGRRERRREGRRGVGAKQPKLLFCTDFHNVYPQVPAFISCTVWKTTYLIGWDQWPHGMIQEKLNSDLAKLWVRSSIQASFSWRIMKKKALNTFSDAFLLGFLYAVGWKWQLSWFTPKGMAKARDKWACFSSAQIFQSWRRHTGKETTDCGMATNCFPRQFVTSQIIKVDFQSSFIGNRTLVCVDEHWQNAFSG